jgi:tetratricopeptide (TPR) repeat protein
MIDQPRASKLAREAFELWQGEQREQAALLYEQAIRLADPQHWNLSTYHGEYACVLNELGKYEQATTQLEKSLAAEVAQGNSEGSPGVIIARYFLADQLLRTGAPQRAIEALVPSLSTAPNDWLTRYVEAHVLFALNRGAEAKTAATLAVSNAPTPEKAEELKQSLGQVFGAPEA